MHHNISATASLYKYIMSFFTARRAGHYCACADCLSFLYMRAVAYIIHWAVARYVCFAGTASMCEEVFYIFISLESRSMADLNAPCHTF